MPSKPQPATSAPAPTPSTDLSDMPPTSTSPPAPTGQRESASRPTSAPPRQPAEGIDAGPPHPAGTFASLRIRNFRLYVAGLVVSQIGNWMQSIALGWLVLRLGASGTELGLVTSARFGPMLLFGAYGGLIADRTDKRRLVITTQAVSGCLALLLAALDLTGVVRLWMIGTVAVVLGVVNAIDFPTRQAFIHELVGPTNLANAVMLNSVTTNSGRAIGPAVAGLVVAAAGTGICFLINGASFLAVILAMLRINPTKLTRRRPVEREKGQLRAGVAYVARTPELRVPILMMALIGILTYEFPVSLPLMARETFSGTAATYGVMTAAMGIGAVGGGLLTARRRGVGLTVVVGMAGAFGVSVLLTAVSPTLPLAVAALVTVGATSVVFMASANAFVQLTADPAMRGRVMALWSVAFIGSMPLGAPVVGFVAQTLGPRASLVLGGIAALVACSYGATSASRQRRSIRAVRPDDRPVVTTTPVTGPTTESAAATEH